MGQGAQSKALIIVSKAKGWDPTRIYDPTTMTYGDSIENFDKAPELFTNQAGTGRLPGGTPDGWPDGVDSEHGSPPGSQGIDWQTGTQSDNKPRATKNANPYPGMDGGNT